jgi:single-stranded-DNA-specific exonuclease
MTRSLGWGSAGNGWNGGSLLLWESALFFLRAGGHKAAGGYSFDESKESELRAFLIEYASKIKENDPELWTSRISFDCEIPMNLANLKLVDQLDSLKPFGHCFEEPRFCIDAEIDSIRFYNDKQTGEPRHTAVTIKGALGEAQKIMFFNEVYRELEGAKLVKFVVSASRNTFRGRTSLSLMGHDFSL